MYDKASTLCVDLKKNLEANLHNLNHSPFSNLSANKTLPKKSIGIFAIVSCFTMQPNVFNYARFH